MKKEKQQKTTAEKVLIAFIWVWLALVVIPFIIEFLFPGLVDKILLEKNWMVIAFLAWPQIIIGLLFAVISKIKKNPKIRARYWMAMFILGLLVGGVQFLVWATTAEDFNDERYVDYKPIIYLYPTETMDVFVQLGRPENLTHTYPKYTDGWQVTAQPDGDLTDDKTGRHYYSLYWEGNHSAPINASDGFIVAGPDTVRFLEEKLAWFGLTEREAQEFIIYWLPKLERNPYNFIRFQTRAEIDENMPLMITPQPNTLIRVMMSFRPAEPNEQVPAQILPPIPFRNGFTVVEWGGTEIPSSK